MALNEPNGSVTHVATPIFGIQVGSIACRKSKSIKT